MIPFIDLKAQQKLIRHKIDERIKTVLDHGQYFRTRSKRTRKQA